jgi:L-iditol 2-dehydrogenase
MIRALMTAPGKIEYVEADKPEARDDELLIKVNRIGICGSDIHVYHGRHPYTSYPVVQGHEVSGDVEEIGKNARGFSKGDKAVFMPQITCGACYPCTHGMYNVCDSLKVMGFQAPGAAQEYFAVPERMALKLPRTVPHEIGAMIEPVSVAVHALGRAGVTAGEIEGKKILVIGAGPIGNLVAQAAKESGAAAVMISDVSEFRLAVARKCSIDFAVNSEKEQLGTKLLDRFGPDRADVIIECVGSEATVNQAISLARKGSTVVIVGVFGSKPVVDMGLVQDRELALFGTLMYRRNDYVKAIELAGSSRLRLKELITETFPFSKYVEAYKHIEALKDRVMKVMIAVS